jgi:hypothetical protein
MIPELSIRNRHVIAPARHRPAAVLCALLVFYSGCAQTFVQDKLNLGLKPTQGKSYVMRIAVEDKVTQGPQGQQINFDQIKTTQLDFDVNGTDDAGVTSIKVTIQAISEKKTNPRGIFEYDYATLANAKDNPLTTTFNAMIGESFMIKVKPSGEIIDVNAEEMFGRMAEKIINTEDEIMKRSAREDKSQGDRTARIEWMKKSVKSFSLTSAEYLKELAGNCLPPYPEKDVKIGGSWAGKFKAMLLIPVETEGTYTLKKRTQERVLIEVNSKKPITDQPIPESGNRATFTGNVSVEGNLEINETTGWLVGKNVKMRLAGEIKENAKTMLASIEKIVTVESME